MTGDGVQGGPGSGLVENAVARAPSRGTSFPGPQWMNRNGTGKETYQDGLLLDHHREVIPARDPGIGPVVDSADLGPHGCYPDCLRQPSCPGWRADLVAHHANRLPVLHEMEHGPDEVMSSGRIDPG